MNREPIHGAEKDRLNIESNYSYAKIFITFFFFILFCRLWYLQITLGGDFRQFSNKNRLKYFDVEPLRGVIYDRQNRILAENIPSHRAVIVPQYMNKNHLENMAKQLGLILGLKTEKIMEKVTRSRLQNGPSLPVSIKEHLSPEEIFKIKMMKLTYSGIDVREFTLRHYPHSEQLAQTLGYVGEVSKAEISLLKKLYKSKTHFKPKDIVGKQGLERSLDFELRGQKGLSFVVVDARGRQKPQIETEVIKPLPENIPPKPGLDIHTTLDLDIQKQAFKAFKKFKRVGSLIAMTPEGEILAWVSYPSFNPNLFSTGLSSKIWKQWTTDLAHPLRNKTVQNHYAPGSTFKPIVGLAGLQQGIIRASQLINSPASYQLGARTWHDHSKTGYGLINVKKALEVSSNVFFYKLGKKLGPDKMALYARAFGLGSVTGIPILGEAKGHIPTKKWKKLRWNEKWQDGESLNMAIGQGQVLATTLQLAQTYSGIALDGAIYKPRIIKKKVKTHETHKEKIEEETTRPILIRHLSKDTEAGYFIEPKYFKTIKQGLWQVINGAEGTAKQIHFGKPFSIAGKTGTAQVKAFSSNQIYKSCLLRPKKEKHNGWFVGYGMVRDKPMITVAVLTENSCTSAASLPIAKEVFTAYFKKYHGDLWNDSE